MSESPSNLALGLTREARGSRHRGFEPRIRSVAPLALQPCGPDENDSYAFRLWRGAYLCAGYHISRSRGH
jgi:hypothetical protein